MSSHIDDIQNDDSKCKDCGESYTDMLFKWCTPCRISSLKKILSNWTSANEKIDEFIQKMQSKVTSGNKIVVEWIPYDQFNNIKNIGNVESAIWKDGPLKYDFREREYKRSKPNIEVNLKCLNDSRNNINGFLNEV
jgi:hypothetical protein